MTAKTTSSVFERKSQISAEQTPRFPWRAPLVGYVRDHIVRVWPREFHPCCFVDRRKRRGEYCEVRGVRFCPQCLKYLCLQHSRGGVAQCCNVHAWESAWDRHEDRGVGVIDAKTRVLISLGGEYAEPGF